MNVVAHTGHEDHAVVYIMEDASGRKLECVESVQPPLSRMDKWVLLVSTLFGCPVGCPMCDAGSGYRGAPDADAIMAQIDYMVDRRFPGRTVPSKQFKIQFARMGEPCLNPAVLEVLRELPRRFNAPGLIPSVSTIAPAGCGPFLDSLKDLKDSLYSGGQFQLQFSIHSTDPDIRRRLIPVNTLNFEDLARFGQRFFQPGDRKITLNFALADHQPVDPDILRRHFPPDRFLIKLTPLNPTFRAEANRMRSAIDPENPTGSLDRVSRLKESGYEVILSIGNPEENRIGSNCGQFLNAYLRKNGILTEGYTYPVTEGSSVSRTPVKDSAYQN